MKRIATANRAIDLFGAGKDGFKAAVPGVSEPTYLSAEWCNAVQESLVRVIERAGLPPGNDHTQFSQAIDAIFAEFSAADLVSFIQAGTGAVPRTAQDKLREFAKTPADIGLAVGDTTATPVTSEHVDQTDVFIDNLRQFNFHTPGADIDEHTFLIPDDKFRVAEASRSIDNYLGQCAKVLFVGDSLTAWNSTDYSYTMQVARRLAELKGGVREVGYLAAEATTISAKQQFFYVSMTHSGFTPFDSGTIPYTDDRRRFSPDGKGYTITGADGIRFLKWDMGSSPLVRYTRYRLYYLQQAGGGTFNVFNRGSTAHPINTAGALSLQVVEFPFVDNGSPLNTDMWIENVTGNVTIYGIELIDDNRASGFTWDVFAISGGALSELRQLNEASMQALVTSRYIDTVVINIGTNDSTQGRTVAEFSADMTAYIAALKVARPTVKICIVTPNNMQWTNFPGSTRAAYENERRKLCRDNQYVHIDLPSEIGNFNHAVAMHWMRDGTHPNFSGQHVIGSAVANKLITNMRQAPALPARPYIPDQGVQARCVFTVAGGVVTLVDATGVTMSYVGVGIYDVQFTGVMIDAYYSVVFNANTPSRAHAITTKTTSGFRIFVTGLTGTAVDPTGTNMTFHVIGKSLAY